MVELFFLYYIEDRSAGPGLGVHGSYVQRFYPRPDYRSRTHGAGLGSDVHVASYEPPAAQIFGSLSYGLNLRMGSRIFCRLGHVVASSDDLSASHYYRSYGDFPQSGSLLGLLQSFFHKLFHIPYDDTTSSGKVQLCFAYKEQSAYVAILTVLISRGSSHLCRLSSSRRPWKQYHR